MEVHHENFCNRFSFDGASNKGNGEAKISVQEGQDCKMKLALKILINIKKKKQIIVLFLETTINC